MTDHNAPEAEDITLYLVKAAVTDTQGENVAPGEQFNNHYVTGPTASASVDQFQQLCEQKGFEIESEISVHELSHEEIIRILTGHGGEIAGAWSEYE